MGTNHRSGKVALVTGGSRGLGVGIAQALADEGADAAITCLVSAEKAEAVARGLEAKDVESAAAFWSGGAPP
ncbi:MAG: SDR family NAD(P)-dependent oxidoreductase, partial [Terrimicrobiaceae bacterium]